VKLSSRTKSILKSFSGINQSIVIMPGNTITTQDEAGILYGMAQVEESFEHEMRIYQLPTLLNMMDSLEDVELDIGDVAVTVRGSRGKYRYQYCAPNILKYRSPWNKEDIVEEQIFACDFLSEDFRILTKASSITGINQICIYTKDGDVLLSLHDKKAEGNSFKTVLGKSDDEFCVWAKTDNLKLLPDDYKMSVNRREGKSRIVSFLSFSGDNLDYLLSCDPSSKV